MATVGQPLTAPETGWTRYDNTNSNIAYIGSWLESVDASEYNGSARYTYIAGDIAEFNFVSPELRIISARSSNKPTSDAADVYIDGILAGTINEYSVTTVYQVLVFEKIGLANREHACKIITKNLVANTINMGIDAIDISSSGTLKPYNPNISQNQSSVGGI